MTAFVTMTQVEMIDAIMILKQKTNENEICLKDIYPKLLRIELEMFQAEKKYQEILDKINEIKIIQTKNESWKQQLDTCTKELQSCKRQMSHNKEIVLQLESKYFTDHVTLKTKIEEQNNTIKDNIKENKHKFDEFQNRISDRFLVIKQEQMLTLNEMNTLNALKEIFCENEWKQKGDEHLVKHYITQNEFKLDSQRKLSEKVLKLEEGQMIQFNEIVKLKSQIVDQINDFKQITSPKMFEFDSMQKEIHKITNIQEQIDLLKSQTDKHRAKLKLQHINVQNDIVYSRTQIFRLVNSEDILKGMTPLHLACEYGLTDIAIKLIKQHAEINGIDNNHMTPLHVACIYGLADIAIKLIEHGANVNVLKKEGMTPLHLLCKNDFLFNSYKVHIHQPNIKTNVNIPKQFTFKDDLNVSVLIQLLCNGVDINSKNNFGWTCLHFAAHGGFIAMVIEILKIGADIHCKSKSGYTALHLAALGGYMEKQVIECLDYDINYKSRYVINHLGITPSEEYLSIVNELINHGADINSKTNFRHSPLHLAAQGGNVSIVKKLLLSGSDINDKDDDGDTPINAAIEFGHLSVITELLNREADIECKNYNGQTSLEFAKELKRPKSIEILKSFSLRSDQK